MQEAVASQGKEAVSGSLFIWFLCAVAFLKISQKIDSFMSGLGVNVGRTGGSLMAEAMIAARGFGVGGKAMFSKGFGSGSSSGGSADAKGGFLSGGLAGVVGRNMNNSALNAATDKGGGLFGKKAFESSLKNGGDFANDIVSKVATGDISKTGSITGETANKALGAYLGLDDNLPELGAAGDVACVLPTSEGGIEISPDNPMPVDAAESVGTQPEAVVVSSESVEANINTKSIPIESAQETGTEFKGEQEAIPQDNQITEAPHIPLSEVLENMPELPEVVPEGFGAEDNTPPVPVLNGAQNSIPEDKTEGQAGSIGVDAPVVSTSTGANVSGVTNQSQSDTVINSSSTTSNASAEVSTNAAVTHQEEANSSVSIQGDSLVTVPVSSDSVSAGNQAEYIGSDSLIQNVGSIPAFSNVEIGGGRITGTETSEKFPNGIEFGMYNTGAC